MSLTRREFLASTGGVAGLSALTVVGRAGPAFGQTAPDPSSAGRNRLVVIFLEGGNDGLNYVAPRGDVPGSPRLSVYRKVRPGIAYQPEALLPIDRPGDADSQLGFNPKLTTLHRFYREGRVAVVQGVDYPQHSYSHFTSMDIWHSGDPTRSPSSGWIGRHLDRAGTAEGELRGVGISSKVPLILLGKNPTATSMVSIGAMRFGDGVTPLALARHGGLKGFGASRPGDPLRQTVGRTQAHTVAVVEDLAKTAAPPATGTHIGNSLVTARVLLEQNLGVECVYVTQPGYDTHTAQVAAQEALLSDLDAALETFWLGTARGVAVGTLGAMKPAIAARTMVLVVSEFGRRIGEAGGASLAGTDHGAAAPVVLIGPPAGAAIGSSLVAGLHGDHPNLGSVALQPDNLEMTTDVRHLYQAVLQSWLGDPDPLLANASGKPLKGLFAAPSGPSGAIGVGGRAARVGQIKPGAGTVPTGTVPAGAGDPLALPDVAAGRSSFTPGRTGSDVGLHPVSGMAALAFNAFVAALVIRSGKFREVIAEWRAGRTAS